MLTTRIEDAIKATTDDRRRIRALTRLLRDVRAAGSDMAKFAELRPTIEELIPNAQADTK